MKRLLALSFVLVLLVMALVPVSAQEEVTVEIYITGLWEDALNFFNEDLFPAFEADHPGVNMEILTGTWGDFDASVAGWITTGEGPDIVYLGSEYAATYGHLLTDIDPYLADWEDLDQFLPTAIDTVSFDGHMRGVPLLMAPRPIFYRTDLMVGEPPLTFADALEFYEANTIIEDNAGVQWGYADINNSLFDSQEFIAYIWGCGGELYYDDGTSTFDSDITAEVLQYMYDRRRIMLPTEDTAGLPGAEGSFVMSDTVVSLIEPMWAMPATDDEAWDVIDMAPYPVCEDGEPLIQVFIDWLSVPAYVPEEKLPVVIEFLKYVVNQENSLTMSTRLGYTPTRQDAWDMVRENPVWDQMIDLTVEYGRSFSDIRASAELRPLIVEQANLFLTDQQSLEDTMTFLKEEYDAILEENGFLD
jgi:multiple sugar transport system substrate-binding protein